MLQMLLFMLLQANVEIGSTTDDRMLMPGCKWGGWSDWSSCDHLCGNAGEEVRSRSHSTEKEFGGSSCSGPSMETRPCNRFCDHSGTPQHGHCSNCPAVYWGTCCSNRK